MSEELFKALIARTIDGLHQEAEDKLRPILAELDLCDEHKHQIHEALSEMITLSICRTSELYEECEREGIAIRI